MLGASTKSFGGLSVDRTAEIFALSGLDCAELCFCQTDLSGWKYNFSGYRALPPSEDIGRAVEVFREHGIKICALGLYSCLWQGDGYECAESLRYFSEYCDVAHDNGIGMVATHTGTPALCYGAVKNIDNIREKAAESFLYALYEAQKRGVIVSVETGENDALCTYGDYLWLKERTVSAFGNANMLKYTGVPVNDGSDYHVGETALFHLKDKKNDGKFYECPWYGDGDLDGFLKKYRKDTGIPLILEYVNSSDLALTAKRVRDSIGSGGVHLRHGKP